MRVGLRLNSSPAFSEVAGVVSTARIERPPFYRGGSASTETIPATSPSSSQTARWTSTGDYLVCPPMLFPRPLISAQSRVAWIGPSLRTSNDHSFIVGVP